MVGIWKLVLAQDDGRNLKTAGIGKWRMDIDLKDIYNEGKDVAEEKNEHHAEQHHRQACECEESHQFVCIHHHDHDADDDDYDVDDKDDDDYDDDQFLSVDCERVMFELLLLVESPWTKYNSNTL